MIPLLAVIQFALPPDSLVLRQAALAARVPMAVVYAVAWQETRVNTNPLVRGPGREQCDSLGCKRVCREIGRMQVNPCIGFKLAGCDSLYAPVQNATCGARILRYLYSRYGNWPDAIRRYNGSGPKSREYGMKALAYIGWFRLREEQ